MAIACCRLELELINDIRIHNRQLDRRPLLAQTISSPREAIMIIQRDHLLLASP